MKLILQNVRCFTDRITVPISPLTFLVGENSSGKSTFLAALAAIFESKFFPSIASFNTPPYDLGTFDTIASYKGGKAGRAKSFTLGYVVEDKKDVGNVSRFEATFGSNKGNISIQSVIISSGKLSLCVNYNQESTDITLKDAQGNTVVKSSAPRKDKEGDDFSVHSIHLTIYEALEKERMAKESNPADARDVWELIQNFYYRSITASSIAPIRSKPRRTYDTLRDDYDPGGDHIPYVLTRLLEDEISKQHFDLTTALNQFGDESGLFKKITPKRLGKKTSDPFQIQVVIAGPPANLLDVGYGVSQSLPVVVESFIRPPTQWLLLQQPEVHLHPKAQAALGTFFAKLVAKNQRKLVVETHSDFLIDRVRQEVAKGSLSSKDVSILFFDKEGIETKIFVLSLDEHGNIKNAPPRYRAFFLNEEIKLLNRIKPA